MNLIFSVFVSRPPPPLPPATPWCSSGPRVHPSSHRHRYQEHLYQSLSPPPSSPSHVSLSLSRFPLPFPHSEPPPTSVRIYLSSVVRFRVIKLARAASLGFYLSEKKRINFERRRRFSAGTLFRFMCANARSGRRQESFILSVLSFSVRLEGEWYLTDQWRKVDRKKAVKKRIQSYRYFPRIDEDTNNFLCWKFLNTS